jgi:hypothetical protein
MQAESFRSKKKPIPGSNAAWKNGSYQDIASAMPLRVQNYLALAADSLEQPTAAKGKPHVGTA